MARITKSGGSTIKPDDLEKQILLENQLKESPTSRFDDLVITRVSDPVEAVFLKDPAKETGGISIKDTGSSGFDFDRVIVKEAPIAHPSYDVASESFGVLKHIDAPNTMFVEAKFNIEKLREELSLDEGADNLLTRIRDYIQRLYDDSGIDPKVLNHFFEEVTAPDDKDKRRLAPLAFRPIPKIGEEFEVEEFRADAPAAKATFKENEHSALFGTGKALRDDIREIQKLRAALLAFRRWQQKQLKLKLAERERIRAQIPLKHRELSNLNRKRIETRGDYQVVQQLVQEDWQNVARQYAERAEILNKHKGLFYARVRETPFSRSLPRELPLRHASADDIVPGCPMQDQDLPDELQTFMDTVLDIPIGSWRALRPHYRLLPNRKRLLDLSARRIDRIRHRLNKSGSSANTPLGVRMQLLGRQNHALLRDASRLTLKDSASLIEVQRNSREVLSLEDLLSGSGHRLRGHAETLHDRLNQAGACLLGELRGVRPSLRLQWAEHAENGSLHIDLPASWPGIDEARDDDFNRVRTLGELIEWWFRQLHEKAPASSRSAVRNLIRACLLLAANDDPDELLQGQLKSPPLKLRYGDSLRVTLNREALPGTLLQLHDRNSRLVGTLRVDDIDDEGAITTITKVIDNKVVPDSGFTCIGFDLPGIKRF